MQVLVSIFAHIYQASKTLILCCHSNSDKHKIRLKMTNSTAVFVVVTPLKRHTFWGSLHYICLGPGKHHLFWHLWSSSYWPMCTNRSKSPLILGTTLEERELRMKAMLWNNMQRIFGLDKRPVSWDRTPENHYRNATEILQICKYSDF